MKRVVQVALLTLLLGLVPAAQAKPFKRVLVLSGGGIAPGYGVGVIAGLQESGWTPDLVIATCGGAIGGALVNSEQGIRETFDLLTSEKHFQLLKQFRIETSDGLAMVNKLKGAKDKTVYPDIYSKNLLYGPEQIPNILQHNQFRATGVGPRMIFVSARALFGAAQVGQKRISGPLFQQVYFTDPDTAVHLKNYELGADRVYPVTNIERDIDIITNATLLNAMRAGIADPYLLNPGVVGSDYHFTGAIDLFPIDLAVELGDEVVSTYPESLFEEYEDDSIEAAFGFKQTKRALEAIQHHDVKWIDQNGIRDVTFNPKRQFLQMISGVPESYKDFKRGVTAQWDLGRKRAREAMVAAPGSRLDVRDHLVKPINPDLLSDFSCKNAYEWKTEDRESCVSDEASGCDRNVYKQCTPLR